MARIIGYPFYRCFLFSHNENQAETESTDSVSVVLIGNIFSCSISSFSSDIERIKMTGLKCDSGTPCRRHFTDATAGSSGLLLQFSVPNVVSWLAAKRL